MARKVKNPINPQSVWQDATVEDNPDAPARIKELRGLKWKRRALMVVAFGAVPAMFVMGAGMVAQANTPTPTDSSTASEAVNASGGKAEAFRALNAWLNTNPSPLPDGVVVSWDGFTVETPPAPTSETDVTPNYTFERHAFTVARGPSMWRAFVQVVVDDALGATATAPPSLEPIADVKVTASEPWFTLSSTSATPAVKQAIEAWAKAFTSGDPDQLHQIVQDRNTDRSYIPLYGVQKFVGVDVVAAGAMPLDEGKGVTADTIVVRVSLSFWWKNGIPVVEPNESAPVPTPVAYDVLVEHADTATPVVVAWGAPGDGPSLKPYQNAVNVVVDAPDRAADENGSDATPTPTPTKDGGN